jgi:hypothetical protein
MTVDADAAVGKTDSCTRAPDKSREIPGLDGSVTPSHPMEAVGTSKVIAAEAMIVFCMVVVNVSEEEPEKINDRRSKGVPEEGVTNGVLDGVIEGTLVPDDVDVPEGVGVPVEVRVVVDVTNGVLDGVIEGTLVPDDVDVPEGVGVPVEVRVVVDVDDGGSLQPSP